MLSTLFLSPALLLIQFVSPITATNGINCKGSSDCSFTSQHNMQEMVDLINSVDDSVCVKEGQKIACIDAGIASLCAFPQKNTGKICAPKLKALIKGLQDHGCTNCGSIPFNHLTGGNNDNLGELTVNAVLGGCVDPNKHPDDVTGCCPGIKCSGS
ncbi:MAG: hypothetical protein Q9214_000786 [Letrouitia sp. 1 TL-2023]